jgi:hypothetical protein
MESYVASGEDALADAKALKELGATRILVPAAMFGSDPEQPLLRYADDVIARI